MSFPANIYPLAIDPDTNERFSEEVIAIAMAKCSRSPNTFMEDARNTSTVKAGQMLDKYVGDIKYGHESVADGAIGSAAFEDISILAGEHVVNIQTGKYQGKSTRYQTFNRTRVLYPWVDTMTSVETLYRDTINVLYDAYEGLFPIVHAWVIQQPNMQDVTAPVIKARVLDSLRYLLPLGALTNFGTRLSARDTNQLIRESLSSGNEEFQDLGRKLKVATELEMPTLVKYAESTDLWRDVAPRVLIPYVTLGPVTPFAVGVELQKPHWGVESIAATAWLESCGAQAFNLTQHDIFNGLDWIDDFMKRRQRRQDPIPHAFRDGRYKFRITADFGVWKDLRRHRRCEIFRGPFTARLGYTVPEDILAIGGVVEHVYRMAMNKATGAFGELHEHFPEEAQYLVTHGHTQTWVMDMDLAQLIYITELRTAPGGHISYRRIARQMYEAALTHHPELLRHARVHPVAGIEAHH